MDKNSKIYKIINLLWVPISWIPFFGGMGIIYAGYKVKHTRWIDEGIIYMIPFMMLSFLVFGVDIPVYLAIFIWLLTIVRSVMIIKPYLSKLEQKNNVIDLNHNQPPKKQYNLKSKDNIKTEIPDQIHYQRNNKQNIKIISINSASKDELLFLPGINQQMAEQIIQYRLSGKYFYNMDELSKTLELNTNQSKLLEPLIDFSRSENDKQARILDI